VIVLDTSALIAIAFGEPEREPFIGLILKDGAARIPSPVYVEATIVCEGRLGVVGRSLFDSLYSRIEALGAATVAFDQVQAQLARDAFQRFGKGRHPAGLNFGDCMAYAVSKALKAPLLFKGEDFRATDVIPAV
jgi:ribonuclease VapC